MKRPKSDALIADIEKNPARALGATRAAERARARSARLMVWPIDAPKGRFPSKIAHYRGEGRGTPIYPAAYPQPDTPTSHNSTTHANQVRSATSHCCVPCTARCSIAFGRCALLMPPPDHCAPCVRSTFVNQGRGSAWELCSRRSNNTREEEVVGRKQRTAADRPTEARSPASGCSVGVLAAILYGETATSAKCRTRSLPL